MVPPGPAPFPSPPSSHLAMARKANSTFMPVLALVSMKGTPYSCQGERVLRASLCLPPPVPLPTRQPLTLASVSPSSERITLSLLTSAYKPRRVTLGKEAPARPSPAPSGPSVALGVGTARPLLVACGTAGCMTGTGRGFHLVQEQFPSRQAWNLTPSWGGG